ncbi:very short patch repair endonuclease [Mycolicibacter heraklionensis]|uniref:Very short patch repair endonuclease n=1 Tax=Mycolicibacter heraklionensis TaxID=512402 RepID=A0A9X7ZEZ1_9MYCO|nr:very short patch repair endonuclease [Mycolicibacter heraklionensis]QZA08391.1 very short patch repair endonuclease [Mycolicibacter heraklionensis]
MSEADHVGAPENAQAQGYVTPPGRSRNMAAIRRRDTKPESMVRSRLHRRGYRFLKDHPVRVEGRLIRPDIVFTKRRVAVFVDGCFWHSCPQHSRRPRVNDDYWLPKLEGNAARDRAQTGVLRAAGWTVLRFWEHEDLDAIIADIESALGPP